MEKKTLFNNKSCFTLVILLLSFLGFSQTSPTLYSSPGSDTFTVPLGVTQITIEAWGGGGRGGSVYNSGTAYAGGGGGGGAYSRKVVTVTPGQTYTVFVGAGGNSGATDGGDSYFINTSTILARGGKSVPDLEPTRGLGGIWTSSNGDIGYNGGNGADGSVNNFSGGGGSSAGTNIIGNNASGTTAGAAPTGGSAGANGVTANSAGASPPSTEFGGGGSGGKKGTGGAVNAGGNGANGQVIISWTAPVSSLTNGPGGVIPNLQLWLRSDLLNGTTTVADNTAVNTWHTQALGTNAIKPTNTGAPIYRNNPTANINFNSVVDFTNNYNSVPLVYTDNDNTRQYLKGTTGFYSQDFFVVLIPDVTITSAVASNDIFCGDRNSALNEPDATGIGYGAYTARFSNEVLTYAIGTTSGTPPSATGYGVANISTTASYSTPGIINARNNAGINGQELFFNANNHVNTTNESSSFVNISNSQYWIGRSEGWTGSLDARVGEIITYSSRLTNIQRSNVQSYLAVKYGITLGVNGTSMNYTNSLGNQIWTSNTGTPANDVFNFNIAGIGRDDIAKLNQKQSKSVNTDDEITIGLNSIAATNTANTNTFDSDIKYLVWGSNNGPLTAKAPVIVNMSVGTTPTLVTNVDFVSINRTWKVVETGGDVPSCKVSIPSAMLTATITPPGDYLMFISSTPTFDPTAEYRIMTVNGSNLETDYDFNGTKYITFGYAPEKTFVRSITFNGTNNYLDAGNVLNLTSSFTVSTWIKRNSANRTILSKRNSAFTIGYDLSINSAGRAEMSWMNGTKRTITSSAVIPTGIWHNIAVTYDGTTSRFYIDGVLDTSLAMPSVPTNTQSFLIAAADGLSPSSFFNGGIDEVRIWNVALTSAQLRYVMNQEIQRNGSATNGAVVPNTITLNDISSIPWSNLSVYYPMSTYTYTNAKDKSNNNFTAALRNLTTVDFQTAPLPYESLTHGAWTTAATWQNSSVQYLPNSTSIVNSTTVNWNIVKTSHNISSTGNKTMLGLFVNSNTLSASNDTKIEVTNYLKLDGKIDLVGMSQLVQTLNCDLDVTSSGSIERDQQGQANKFNYNYWSSPVSPTSSTQNNLNYTITAVMKDGFNAIPRNITWIDSHDGIAGNASTAMSVSRFWLNKFDNSANLYSNWVKITENSSLRVGQGFTMKGSGVSGTQSYTFVGKPNNGLINSNTVSSDQLLLTGNPYPSALDADAFIIDNVASVDRGIDGTLYFWEHYATNNTHVLTAYQGGYGVRNLVGGIAPVSTGIDFISQSGITSKGIPNRYIPVGQGFFINGKVGSGGTLIFNNNQRAFFKENEITSSNTIYKTRNNNSKTSNTDHWNDNSNDQIIAKNDYKKIRLGFNSSNSYHRQVLLGFMNEKATDAMDYGFDAINYDDFPNDMYFLNNENQLVIQGVGAFDPNASYPIGVKTTDEGKVSFMIDDLENFDETQPIFIYDNNTDIYHNIRKDKFDVYLNTGEEHTRFSLRFTDKTLKVAQNTISETIQIKHLQKENKLIINNYLSDVKVEKMTLYSIIGQSISTFKIENQEQTNIQIPIKNLSSGVYIVKLNSTKGEVSKKIIIP